MGNLHLAIVCFERRGVLVLPSRSTLKRYIGACTGQVVSSLIQQRLHVEAKLHNEQARCGSLVMDEMSIKQAITYQNHSDTIHGLVDLGGAEEDYGLEDQLATQVLCFVFVGLSTHYRLPVGYYFTKALNGEQLHHLGLKVMESVEDAGFKVTRLVGDNHSASCKFFCNVVWRQHQACHHLNGSNDQTDAYAALSALQKVLVTDIIHSSPSSNVGSVVGQLGEASVPPLVATKASSRADIKKLLRPHLTMLERYPNPPQQSLRSSTLALIAGFLVRAVQDNITCEGCILKLESPKSHSTTTALIADIDRGGLSYPSIAFVGFVSLLELAASRVAALLMRQPQPLQKFVCAVLPSILKNPLFKCERDDSVAHTTALVKLIILKFLRPFLANVSSNMTEKQAKRKLLHTKPQSRKVLKV
ncbi:hypothetical protein MTO96_016462 [Rhipicephalus appendiculatus]